MCLCLCFGQLSECVSVVCFCFDLANCVSVHVKNRSTAGVPTCRFSVGHSAILRTRNINTHGRICSDLSYLYEPLLLVTFVCWPMMTIKFHAGNSEPGEGVVPPQVIERTFCLRLLDGQF